MSAVPRRALALALILGAGPAAGVELRLTPYAAAQYLDDSNVFRFSDQVAQVTGTTETADRITRYTGGLDGSVRWQRQTVQYVAERRKYGYEEHPSLDHDEGTLSTTLDSFVGEDFHIAAGARSERRLASFADRRSTEPIIERDRSANAQLTVTLAPMWRVTGGLRGSDLKSPLPAAPALPQPPPGAGARNAAPDFAVRQSAVHAGVLYGIENKVNPEIESPLVLGVQLERETVAFRGLTPQPPPPPGAQAERFDDYSLLTLAGTATYALSGYSRFDAKAGVSRFSSDAGDADGLPPLTGEIAYARNLSVVTEISARLFSKIQPFAAAASATTDTGVGIGVKWEPIRYWKLFADYSYANSAFTGLGVFAAETSSRTDQVQNASLRLEVPYGQWIFLRLGGNYSERNSRADYDDFVDRSAFAEVVVLWDAFGSPGD